MGVWPSWSQLHPPRTYSRQSEKPSRWKWQGPLPTWVAPNNSQEDLDGEAGVVVRAGGLQPSKLSRSPRPMPSRMHLDRSLMRPMLQVPEDVAVGVCRLTSAANAMDMVTGLFSARPEVEHVGDEEVVVVEVDAEEAGMLVQVEVEQDQVRYPLLL